MRLDTITLTPDACDGDEITVEWLDKVSPSTRFLDLNGYVSWRIKVPQSGEFTVGGFRGHWWVGVSGVNGFVPQYRVSAKGHVRMFARLRAIASGNDPSGDQSPFRREAAELFAGTDAKFCTVDKIWAMLFPPVGDTNLGASE